MIISIILILILFIASEDPFAKNKNSNYNRQAIRGTCSNFREFAYTAGKRLVPSHRSGISKQERT